MPAGQCRSVNAINAINARRRCVRRSAETGLVSRAWRSASGAGTVLPALGGLRLRAVHPRVKVRAQVRKSVRALLAAAAGRAADQQRGRRMETPCIPGLVAMGAVSGPAVSLPCRCVFHLLCPAKPSWAGVVRTKKSRLKPARVFCPQRATGVQRLGACATVRVASAGANCSAGGEGFHRLMDATTAIKASAKAAGSTSKWLLRTKGCVLAGWFWVGSVTVWSPCSVGCAASTATRGEFPGAGVYWTGHASRLEGGAFTNPLRHGGPTWGGWWALQVCPVSDRKSVV